MLQEINQIKILNFQGQIVLESTKTSQIDVSILVPGIYFVGVFGGSGSNVKKFIKQ